MRISDAMLTTSYLNNLSKSLARLDRVQTEMSTKQKLLKASDNPNDAAQVMDYKTKLSQINLYSQNIDDSVSFVTQSLTVLSQMDDTASELMAQLASAKNANLNDSNLDDVADKIDAFIASMLDNANAEYQGKYLFGGTDSSQAPLGYTSDKSAIEIKSSNISGDQNVRISPTITTKINLSGSDLFSTIISQNGNLNSADPVGTVSTTSTKVYDAGGTEYTLNMSYEKTAADTYSMTYDIVDSTNTSVYATSPSAQTMVFDSSTGKLKTINGSAPSAIDIKVPSSTIDFSLDTTALTQKNAASSFTNSANQKTNIFNTLISIRDGLKNGTLPTTAQTDAVQSFYDNLVNKESIMGNTQIQLENVKAILTQKTTDYKELISNKMDADVASLTIELQNQQYSLESTYKMASYILPKSLMDYL
jgi:flagellar hook-associated protein 3 FlgL